MRGRAGSFLFGCIHCSHFLGHVGFELFVFFAAGREFVEHVIGIFVVPVLFGVVIGQFSGATLLVLLVSGVGQGRVADDGSAGESTFDEMAGADGVFADGGDVFLALNFAGDGDVADFAAFGGLGEKVFGKFD